MTELKLPNEAVSRLKLLHLLEPVLKDIKLSVPLYAIVCKPESVALLDIMYGQSDSMTKPVSCCGWLEELHLPIRHLRKDITFWQLLWALHTGTYYSKAQGLTPQGQGFYECIAAYACVSPEPA